MIAKLLIVCKIGLSKLIKVNLPIFLRLLWAINLIFQILKDKFRKLKDKLWQKNMAFSSYKVVLKKI
jgi:hypothetical protein